MEPNKSPKPKIGNADIADKLAAIDYRNLTGDNWGKYLDITEGELPQGKKLAQRVGGLATNTLYDYVGYRCAAIKEELYEGVKDTPLIITGITLKTPDAPEIKTRITAGRAKLLNDQLPNFTVVNSGIYYLITKVEPTEETKSKAGRPAKEKAE